MSPQDTITTTCPSCGESFDVPADFIGRKGKCESCETKFIIDESVATSPPPSPPEDAPPKPPVKNSKPGSKLPLMFLLLLLAGAAFLVIQQQGDNQQGQPPHDQDTSHSAQPIPAIEPASSEQASEQGGETDSPSPPIEAAKLSTPTPLSSSFPVKKTFEMIDIGHYKKTYPNVHQGYLPTPMEKAEEAKTWGHYLGPLGVRIRSHVPQRQNRPAFVAIIPHSIRTEAGELGITAAEVVQIAPESPAEGHLEIGDLIIGIEGETLKSGNKYRPDWDFMHKDQRELQLMLGEKIDQAQGRGDVRLTVLRYPGETATVFSQDLRFSDGRVSSKTVPVSPGDQIRLLVSAKGSNEGDHFAWLSPQLLGDGSKLDLSDGSQISPDTATTGWGEIAYNKDLAGKPLGEKGFCVHAESVVTFTVPDGYHSFQTSMKVAAEKGDLNAIVQIVKHPQPLPVKKQELWKGVGGNQSVGVQSFDIEVPAEGRLTLETHHFDGHLGGDGSLWMNVTLEGDYGSKQLLAIPWDSAAAGYGSPSLEKKKEFKGELYDLALNLHAHGTAVWTLPKGTKRVKGLFSAGSYGKVQPIVSYTNLAYPLTGIHKDKVLELRFPVGKAGSFSDTYPVDCPKSELTVKRHTAWLAAQQRENGSWPRLHGYTTDGWDTSWCALALMSSGDSQYDSQIRKAAYRIAYDTAPSEWIAERAMRLILLSEYYFRTQDSEIVAGIQAAYHQVIACCKTDFMAGHKVNGFGYGIAGQHYGTGHMALAIALAAKTPIKVDQTLVEGIIRHAGEVCVNGTYAYGRGRRMARDDSRRHGGGNAMVGPGMLGAILAGGHQSSIKEVLERWDASLGDADNSHATSSLAFIWASLAMAAEDKSLFLKSMQNFKYKMTIDDNWEGGILKSAFPLDYQSGEGVTAIWIRTAGSILVLNATKHNLAISGKKELIQKERITTTAVSEWGAQVHSYYFRNWCLVQELLGQQSPQGVATGIAKLKSLPRTMELVPNTRKVVTEMAPGVIAQIAKNNNIPPTHRAYAIELLCGLDFIIRTTQKEGKQVVDLTINQPFHQLNWLDENKSELFDQSPLPLSATVTISGDNLGDKMEFKVDDLKGFNLDTGSRKMRAEKPLKNASKLEYKGGAEISFTLGGTKVSYRRPLFFNTKLAYSDNTNLRRLRLKLRMAPRAYYQSQPLIIAGTAFDCMFPVERMADVIPPQKGVINIHEGDVVTVDISSENFICPWVHSLKFDTMTQVKIAKAKNITSIRGKIKGDLNHLHDFDYETFCDMQPDGGKNIVEYDFGQAVTLNGLDVNYRHGGFLRVWFYDGKTWIPIAWDNYSPDTSYNPTFPDTKAQRWRVEINSGRDKRIHTLRFYFNPNMINKQEQAPHVSDGKLIPASIQPE